MQKQPT